MKPTSFVIRPYRAVDAPTLLALFKDTIRRVNSRDYAPDQIDAWSSDEIDHDAWRQRFDGRFAIVAELGGHPVGFADLTPEGHFDRLFVSADHQRQGIATALTDAVIAEALRLGLKRIDVNVSITARPFFESRGFRIIASQSARIRGTDLSYFQMEYSIDSAHPTSSSSGE
jgi:putative acetyltransferase